MSTDRPAIAVTGRRDPHSGHCRPDSTYLHALEVAGGAPFGLKGPSDLTRAAALVLSGGGDVAPRFYGQPPHPRLGGVDEERDQLELGLVREALRRDLPLFGICRGLQVLVVACGGSLWQDLPSQLPGGLDHGRGAGRAGRSERTTHPVRVQPGSLLARVTGALEFEVNSSHHQAAQVLGGRLAASAFAADGIVEAVEAADARFAVGVQWHPEEHPEREPHAALLAALVAAARG